MATLFIESAGYFGSPTVMGKNPSAMQDDIAVRVRLIGTALFAKLTILKCGIPLRHESGKLKIRSLHVSEFTADAINTVGDLHINRFVIYDRLPFRYSGNYHKDSCFQAFSSDGIVRNIAISNIFARITGTKKQFIMLSEGDHRYTGISICKNGNANIILPYKYAFVANQLDTSYINVGKNGIKIKKVKPTSHHCFNVIIKAHKGQLIVLDDFYVKRGAFKYESNIMTRVRAKHLQKLLNINPDGNWNIKSQFALELFARKKGITLKRIGIVPIKIYLQLLFGNEKQ